MTHALATALLLIWLLGGLVQDTMWAIGKKSKRAWARFRVSFKTTFDLQEKDSGLKWSIVQRLANDY
jgi:hypothetical protein